MLAMPWRPTFVALAFLVGTHGLARARCGDDPGDAQAVADARAQVDADCDCAGAPSHRDYVRCALGVARTRADAGQLRSQCRSAVKRCAAKSTCGKPGAVTCCIERNGSFRCLIRHDATSCAGRGGTTGTAGSCCDTCGGGVPTSTTTSSPATTTTVYIPPCGFLPGRSVPRACRTGEHSAPSARPRASGVPLLSGRRGGVRRLTYVRRGVHTRANVPGRGHLRWFLAPARGMLLCGTDFHLRALVPGPGRVPSG